MATILTKSTQPKNLTSNALTLSETALKWTGVILVTTVWISAGLFGLYILAFYASALYEGEVSRWNNMLPNLYAKNATAATSGIGLHFAMGGIILILGSLQLIDSVRTKFPAFHRWVGRLYVLSCLLAAVGGLIFIVIRGTIGGIVMDIGFSLYGILMFIAAVQTYRFAVSRSLILHRAWALRLYALAIGSWLYRMDYGFWLLLSDGLGHTRHFSGPFDMIMAFFFYVPNLLIAEIFIRSPKFKTNPLLNFSASLILLLSTGFLLVGTYYFTLYYWGPAIIKWLS